jgi:hypothetical protein
MVGAGALKINKCHAGMELHQYLGAVSITSELLALFSASQNVAAALRGRTIRRVVPEKTVGGGDGDRVL